MHTSPIPRTIVYGKVPAEPALTAVVAPSVAAAPSVAVASSAAAASTVGATAFVASDSQWAIQLSVGPLAKPR